MRKARRLIVLLLACAPLALLSLACGLGESVDRDITDEEIADLRGRIPCPSRAAYCEALDRFARAQLPGPTASAYSLVGRSYYTWDSAEAVNWFVARPGEAMGSGEITPDNPEEEQQLRDVLGMLGTGSPVPADHPVAAFVATLAQGGQEPSATEVRGRSRFFRSSGANPADAYVRQDGTDIILVMRNDSGGSVAIFRRP